MNLIHYRYNAVLSDEIKFIAIFMYVFKLILDYMDNSDFPKNN